MTRSPPPISNDEFIALGNSEGWKLIAHKTDVRSEGVRLKRLDLKGKIEIITYWETTGKVATKINGHPKDNTEASTQFSNPTRMQLKRMLTEETGPGKGLRTHTNTGYKTRKNKKNKSSKKLK